MPDQVSVQFWYLFSAFEENRKEVLRDSLEHLFMLKMTLFWNKRVLEEPFPLRAVCLRAGSHATSKALNRYRFCRRYFLSTRNGEP